MIKVKMVSNLRKIKTCLFQFHCKKSKCLVKVKAFSLSHVCFYTTSISVIAFLSSTSELSRWPVPNKIILIYSKAKLVAWSNYFNWMNWVKKLFSQQIIALDRISMVHQNMHAANAQFDRNKGAALKVTMGVHIHAIVFLIDRVAQLKLEKKSKNQNQNNQFGPVCYGHRTSFA